MKNTFLLSCTQSANHPLILAGKKIKTKKPTKKKPHGLNLILGLIFVPVSQSTSGLTLPFRHFFCGCLARAPCILLD